MCLSLPAHGPSSTHPAEIGFGIVICGHIPAVIRVAPAAIQCGIPGAIAGEIKYPAIDREVSVGVYAIPLGCNGNIAAIDLNESTIHRHKLFPSAAEAGAVRSAGSIEAVIVCGDLKIPTVYTDRQPLDPLIAIWNGEGSVLNDHSAVGM